MKYSLLMVHPKCLHAEIPKFRPCDHGRVDERRAWRVIGARRPPSTMQGDWRFGDEGSVVFRIVFEVLPQIERGDGRPCVPELDSCGAGLARLALKGRLRRRMGGADCVSSFR